MVTLVAEMFGYFVAVEFVSATAAQIGGADANGCFKRNELTGFSSHRATIRRYMLIVKPENDRVGPPQSPTELPHGRSHQDSRWGFRPASGIHLVAPAIYGTTTSLPTTQTPRLSVLSNAVVFTGTAIVLRWINPPSSTTHPARQLVPAFFSDTHPN